MATIITKNTTKEFGYIKANRSIYHPTTGKPFIKGNIYKFELEDSVYDSELNAYVKVISIYSNTNKADLEIRDTSQGRKEFAKFVNTNFTECPKPIYTVDSVIDPTEYKFCIVDGSIVEINFDTVLYTNKINKNRYCSEVYVNQYNTFLGILITPVTERVIKESDYILKTKIEVLKEIYGDFEVENPNSYDLVQEGFCTNGWYEKDNIAQKHFFSEIFYTNGVKYLGHSEGVPKLLADSAPVENCFKTKQEAITKLLT